MFRTSPCGASHRRLKTAPLHMDGASSGHRCGCLTDSKEWRPLKVEPRTALPGTMFIQQLVPFGLPVRACNEMVQELIQFTLRFLSSLFVHSTNYSWSATRNLAQISHPKRFNWSWCIWLRVFRQIGVDPLLRIIWSCGFTSIAGCMCKLRQIKKD